VELLFAMAASWWFFRERILRLEVVGIVTILVAVLWLVLEA
jgi:drug/metabolite transporter (DMT)-like permease